MVTRTKAKTLPELAVGVTLRPPGRESVLPLLFEVLNVDSSDPSADSVEARIQSTLEHCARRLLVGERFSMPAHTVAALEPIASQANALALLLDPWTLAQPVVRGLGVDRDQLFALRRTLEDMANNAQREIRKLKKSGPSRGKHNAHYAEALEGVQKVLGDLFESLRIDSKDEDPSEREGDKQEFIRRCRGRLPAAPAHRERKKKGATKRAK
jgi:hypothetical protein